MIYQRHTLCYLKPDAKPLSIVEDELLPHWMRQQFPLIYTHQPSHLGPKQVKLAIPYFDQRTQEKIRRSYLFSPDDIAHSKSLPELHELFPNVALKTNTRLHVYGSYCWQHITKHPYVQAASDLDLQCSYNNESLAELTRLFYTLQESLPIASLDGEVRFPHVGDCSWLELIHSSSDSILFKSEHLIHLIPREQLYADVPALLA